MSHKIRTNMTPEECDTEVKHLIAAAVALIPSVSLSAESGFIAACSASYQLGGNEEAVGLVILCSDKDLSDALMEVIKAQDLQVSTATVNLDDPEDQGDQLEPSEPEDGDQLEPSETEPEDGDQS